MCDPDNQRAEFAIQIATDWQRQGLGRALLEKLLRYLRARGVREVAGECLNENVGMVAFARDTGFSVQSGAEAGVLSLRLSLL